MQIADQISLSAVRSSVSAEVVFVEDLGDPWHDFLSARRSVDIDLFVIHRELTFIAKNQG